MARAKCRRYQREVGEQGADTMNSCVPTFISSSLSPSSDLVQCSSEMDTTPSPPPFLCRLAHLALVFSSFFWFG
jgi:hypothetical protein